MFISALSCERTDQSGRLRSGYVCNIVLFLLWCLMSELVRRLRCPTQEGRLSLNGRCLYRRNMPMKQYLLVSVVMLSSSVCAHATTVVYDSLSGYVPENTPGASPSWLNGDVEQGIRISRSLVNQPLTKAEFFVRNGFLDPLDTSTTIRFYSDSHGFPNILLATVEDSISLGARGVEQVSIDLPSILIPDDPIWVTWIFGSTNNGGGVTLGATTSIGTDFATRARRSRLDGSWLTDNPFAFVVNGGGPPLRLSAIPEPSGALLCVSSIALFIPRQRRHTF